MPEHSPITTYHRDLGLDAVRACAIWLVMVSHGIVSLLEPTDAPTYSVVFLTGVIGVELFFCLSGFLIGRILLDIEALGFSGALAQRFLVRRWLRTLPLYYVFLGAAAVFWPRSSQTLPALLTMSQNLFTLPEGENYFPQSWTLPIEEFTYILLPLLALCLRRNRQPILNAALLIIAVSVGFRIVFENGLDYDQARLIAAGRLDSIIYGVLASILERRFRIQYSHHRTTIVIVAICIGLLHIGVFAEPSLANGFYGRIFSTPAFDISVAALLPAICRPTLGVRFVDRLVQSTSKQAYGLYIVHVVAATTVHVGMRAWPLFWQIATYILVTYAAATALSILVERPFMRIRPSQIPSPVD